MSELEKVKIDEIGEGEARRYADHAITLAQTVKFLRHNPNLQVPESDGGVDLVRCERLNSLEEATRLRILNKNYAVLVSMAPISAETTPVTSCIPPHFGPTLAEVNSVWFKLFLYSTVGSGPTSVLLTKGTRLKKIPTLFKECERICVSTWEHDSFTHATHHALPILNDYLLSSPVLVQAYMYSIPSHIGLNANSNVRNAVKQYQPPTVDVAFPLEDIGDAEYPLLDASEYDEDNMHTHPVVRHIQKVLELEYSCGFIRMQMVEGKKNLASEWVPIDIYFGIPIFNSKLNKIILERIERRQLFTEENLKKQSKSSKKLALKLLNFIAQFHTPSDNQDQPSDIGICVPFPSKQVTFSNGIAK